MIIYVLNTIVPTDENIIRKGTLRNERRESSLWKFHSKNMNYLDISNEIQSFLLEQKEKM